MTQICLYFQVHQPMRLRRLKAFHTPPGHDYWDHATNREIFERAADKCYIPANRMMDDPPHRRRLPRTPSAARSWNRQSNTGRTSWIRSATWLPRATWSS